ncbi:MAG: beta-galactosidase trimerization domain-containing protein [Acidobacteriia bacterium]|nr:beta-galactosidase trimerization domain-containing protein [Terriglobia bacterium]
MNRRVFLAGTAGIGVAAQTAPAPEQPGWFDRPMRWAQLTLAENDPGQYDSKFWLDYFRRTHADAACLSAGGCVAYYPTRVPLHHRSAWLKDSDAFGELVTGCRKMNMVVLARTDPHSVVQEAYEARPDWIAVDAEGRKRKHWATPGRWVTCALGPYNFEFMTEVTKEIVSLYKVDGVFSNRWTGSGMCYCEHCASNFRAASGLDLPRTSDPLHPARRAYILWRQKRIFDLWTLWDSGIRKINPAACFIANSGGGALSELNMKTIGERAPILFADRQARRGVAAAWSNGKNGKEYRATMGRKPIGGIFSIGVEEQYRWKDSVQSEAEIRLWVADGIANGLRPWYTKFAGVVDDRRWLKTVEDIYAWHKRCENYLRNEEPLARVGMVYSQQTATFYGGDRKAAKVEDHTLGFYHALIEARLPFEMVHDGLLDAGHVDRFKTLILPNIAALSNAQCEQLRQYAARGGSLVATYETSLYDEWGVRRTDFGLGSLFGVSFQGRVEGPMRNSYLRLERTHPILAGLGDTDRIINGVHRVEVKASVPFPNPPLTLVPSYPDLPMEEVYARQPRTNIPELYFRETGASRIVYFPWDIDRTFWEVLCVDHGKLLANAVDWAANEERPVTVTGPGVLDVTLWRQKDSMTVHLVNLTNPMMMKGPVRELMPVGPQQVRVRLPGDRRPKKVQLLTGGGAVRTRQTGNVLEVTVPSILVHEVVAIDL